jgi:hypothetical protein
LPILEQLTLWESDLDAKGIHSWDGELVSDAAAKALTQLQTR